jgi:hypothetical protein
MAKQPPPQREWEQALIDAYHDYRWRQVLQPLYDDFQRWAAGELKHDDMNEAIHAVHKKNQGLYSLFTERRSWLVRAIQMDEDWFQEWVKDHPAPSQAL